MLDLSPFALEFGSGALGKITNANYTISLTGPANVSVATFLAFQATLDATPGGFTISDLGSNIAASIDALNADPNVTAISVYGGYGGTGGTVVLSAAQALSDTRALALILNSGSLPVVTDSVANILANYAALAAGGQISSIVAQDTAANVLASASTLDADSLISSITVVDTAANAVSSEAALSALTKPVTVKVVDSAADVSALIDQLNSDPAFAAYPSSITLSDAGTPALTLTVAQALNDTNALNAIGYGTYGIAIVDTAANVAQTIDALSRISQVSQISSITLTDSTHLALTLDAADAVSDSDVLSKLTNASCDVAVADTAANIESNIDSLNADPNISSITVQGGGTAVITVTAAQAAAGCRGARQACQRHRECREYGQYFGRRIPVRAIGD